MIYAICWKFSQGAFYNEFTNECVLWIEFHEEICMHMNYIIQSSKICETLELCFES
jgi:hypothetical protein